MTKLKLLYIEAAKHKMHNDVIRKKYIDLRTSGKTEFDAWRECKQIWDAMREEAAGVTVTHCTEVVG